MRGMGLQDEHLDILTILRIYPGRIEHGNTVRQTLLSPRKHGNCKISRSTCSIISVLLDAGLEQLKRIRMTSLLARMDPEDRPSLCIAYRKRALLSKIKAETTGSCLSEARNSPTRPFPRVRVEALVDFETWRMRTEMPPHWQRRVRRC